jgi:hypothetical protein
MKVTCGALGSGQRGRLGRVRLVGFGHDFDLFFFFYNDLMGKMFLEKFDAMHHAR